MPWGFCYAETLTIRKRLAKYNALPGVPGEAFFVGGKEMPRRSDKRDAAREAYLSRRRDGKEVSLQELAEELGVKYDTLRRWKSADKWDEMKPPPKRARGGQPKNKNAMGNTGGAPPRNQNARTHGGYAAVFFDQLTDDEVLIMDKTPKSAVEALREELGILKVQEKRILDQITTLENADPEEL